MAIEDIFQVMKILATQPEANYVEKVYWEEMV